MFDSSGARTLSLSAAERHEPICDRFEDRWRAGARPRIEDFLPEVPSEERPVLFDKLLRLEREYRRDDPAVLDDLRARFPADAAQVELVFGDPARTASFGGLTLVPPSAPPTIPGYEVTGTLGVGGMGVVYRAHDIDLDRPVAIKMMLAGLYDRPDQLLRFHLEARAAAALSHANIVPIYDFGQVDDRPFQVMELVEGGSLADLLKAGPTDPTWSAGVVERVARAVDHIHTHRLIHRDLKPANVLLAVDGTPKVTDFGLAKRLAGDDPRLTDPDAIVGTACYMSPEQARGDAAAVGPATDVYALGAILYECLTGRPPFCARTYALTLTQVLTEDPRRPADLVDDLPPDLEAVCLKCLEKDSDRRYLTAAEVADELAQFLAGAPVRARPLTTADVHARWADRVGYELGEPVGTARGVFTYQARQASIGRTVRLKLAADPAAHAALRREAEAMAGVDHPNVIRLHDYGEQFGQPYLVQEDPDGGRPLAEHGPEPTRQVAALGLMLALGVQAVHANGFLHLGLWTGSVFISRDGVVKIGDFSTARRRGRSADPPETPLESVPPSFQSPEVRTGAWNQVGPPADVYSVGAILHKLLYSEAPPAGPGQKRTGVLPELDRVVRKCLADDSADRYPSADALLLALQLARGSGGTDPSTVGDSPAAPDGGAPAGRSAAFQLRVARGPKMVGQIFPITRDRLIVGRSAESQIHLLGERVSRPHCAILWDAEAGFFEVVDLESLNGTFVNAHKVRGRRLLAAGDRLRVGEFELNFEPRPPQSPG
jgi:serine/threonine protein kinase